MMSSGIFFWGGGQPLYLFHFISLCYNPHCFLLHADFVWQQDAEAQRQIQQMVNFITNEARDKSQEIEAKALEDFNIEKLKLVQQMKNQVRQEYQLKAKQMETQRAM